MSRKVLNVSDLAYTILCGLPSSITQLPRPFTKFLKFEQLGFQTESLICQNKAQFAHILEYYFRLFYRYLKGTLRVMCTSDK